MVQVVKTNKNHLVEVKFKLEATIKQMKKFFGRVNHIYFTEPTEGVNERARGDLNVIDDMKFEIAVQLFSNVGRKISFNIDLKKASVTPDEMSKSELTAALRGDEFINIEGEFKEVSDHNSNCTSNYEIGEHNCNNMKMSETHESNTNTFNPLTDDFTCCYLSSHNDSDSDYEPSDDSDYESSESDVEGWNVKQFEKRVYGNPNKECYDTNKFITKVKIEKMLELGDFVTKGYHFVRKDHMSKRNLQSIHRKDVVARAVRYAHSMILTGQATVRDFANSDSILQGAAQYCIPSSYNLQRRWGRRCKMPE